MRNPICFFRWIWRSLRYGSLISGHEYVEVERTNSLQVLRCTTCGYESLGVHIPAQSETSYTMEDEVRVLRPLFTVCAVCGYERDAGAHLPQFGRQAEPPPWKPYDHDYEPTEMTRWERYVTRKNYHEQRHSRD